MEAKEKDQHHHSTSLKSNSNIHKLLIECTLIAGLLPYFKITYQNRVINGVFSKTIWGDEAAIFKMATGIIEQQHFFEPFKTQIHE